jgi:hypothetical protein
MKPRILFAVIALGAILTASGCAPLMIARVDGTQPEEVIEVTEWVDSGNLPVAVEHVEIQVGVGSPALVEIVASGTWPDLCSQVARIDNKMEEEHIDITILASSRADCPPDFLGLPFRLALPLNIVEMPAGIYTISVNGQNTTLELPLMP